MYFLISPMKLSYALISLSTLLTPLLAQSTSQGLSLGTIFINAADHGKTTFGFSVKDVPESYGYCGTDLPGLTTVLKAGGGGVPSYNIRPWPTSSSIQCGLLSAAYSFWFTDTTSTTARLNVAHTVDGVKRYGSVMLPDINTWTSDGQGRFQTQVSAFETNVDTAGGSLQPRVHFTA